MRSEELEIVRQAFAAFLAGDIASLRERVDPDLEWTYLDPSFPDPQPATCHGREELERAVGVWAGLGLTTMLEELEGKGEKVLVILHAAGPDQVRVRAVWDRNFHVATVRNGKVCAIRACRNREEARQLAGLSPVG